MEVLMIFLVLLIMFVGFCGVFLPFLPGVPVAWLGLFAFAFYHKFTIISLPAVIIFLILSILTSAIDIAAPLLGAKKYDASKFGIAGAALGFLTGVITLGPIGIIAGPLLGAFLGEVWAGKESERAWRSAFGAFLGFLAGSLIKVVLIFMMIGYFILALF